MAGRSAQEIYENLTNVKGIPSKDLSAHYDRWAFEAHDLPGGGKHDILLDRSPETLSQRISIAQSLSRSLLPKVVAAGSQSRQGHTKGAVAGAYVEILKNKDKYGIEGKTEEEILEAAWYSAETADSLHPDQIKADLIKKKQEARRAELEKKITNKQALENKYNIDATRIAAQGPTEKELRDARREATIAYLEAQQADKVWAGTTSNSMGDLYSAESLALVASAMGKAGPLTAESREAISGKLNELSQKSTAVSGLLKAGKYAEVFSNPSGYLASKAGGAVTKFAAKKASEWAVKAALAIGLNAVAPVVGQVVAEVVSRVIGPQLQKAILGSIDRVKGIFKKAGATLAGLAVLVGSAMGPGVAMAATAAGVSAIVIVPIVALIMFIINASGYVVPPGSALTTTGTQPGTNGASAVENPYIRVVKTANPPGPFPNNALPLSVQYTITVTAKKETLTNVTFDYNCQVIKDGGATCPPVSPAIPAAPATITTDTPVTFTYTQNYSVAFQNSLVMDNLVVSAKVASDPAVQTSSGFAAIIIGNPPTKCFVLDSTWNDRDRGIILQAIAQIVQFTGYVDKLCARGNVNLIDANTHACYSPEKGGTNYWPQGCQSQSEIEYGGLTNGRTVPPSITFYALALTNPSSAFYTLSHESGHIFQAVQPTIWGVFRDSSAIPVLSTDNGYICTYPIKGVIDPVLTRRENFAESISLYIRNNNPVSSATRDFTCLAPLSAPNPPSFQNAYPAYYNYMESNVFN